MGLTPEQNAAVDGWLAKQAPNDAPLVKALLTAGELSNGDPTATSPKGAKGLMQLTPIALKDIGIDPDTFDYTSPAESLRAGTKYVQHLRDHYGFTNPLQIAAAYNAGPGAVKKAVEAGSFKALPAETQAYIARMQTALAAVPTPAPSTDVASEAPGIDLGGPQSAAAEEAPPTTPAVPEAAPGLLASAVEGTKQFGQGAVNTVTGLRDLAQAPVNYLSGKVGLPPYQGANAEGMIAGEPQTVGQRYVRAAGEGAPFGGVGVAGSLLGEAGGDAMAALGVPRVVGEVVAPLLAGGVSGVRSVAKAGRTIRTEAKAAEAAAKAAVPAARAQTQEAVATLKTATVERAQAAERVAQRMVQSGEQDVAQATAAAVTQEAQAARGTEALLMTAAPAERAQLLGAALRGEHEAFQVLRRDAWQGYLGQWGQTPVDLSRLGLTAEDMVDHMTRAGVASDVARSRAESVLRLLRPVETGLVNAAGASILRQADAIPLDVAQTLRSELGAIFGKATGATESRAGRLYGTLNQAIERALPEEAIPGWREVNRITRHEVNTYRNPFVRKALDNSEQGRATAEAYLENIVAGAWSRTKNVQVRRLVQAAGTNTTAHEVLKDALIRKIGEKITKGGVVNYQHGAAMLRNPEGYGPVFESVVRDPRERQALLGLWDQAALARTEATRATERLAATTAQAGRLAPEVTARGREWAQAARIAGNRETRQAIAAARTATARRAQVIAGPTEPTVLDGLMGTLFTYSVGGLPGVVALKGGLRAVRFLRQPQNRTVLREAMRTAASSEAGRKLLQRLAPNLEGAMPQTLPAVMRGPQSVAAQQAGAADAQVQTMQ